VVTGYRCAVCGAFVDVATPWPWQCPNATATDRAHVLHVVPGPLVPAAADPNPFVAYRHRMAWYAFARSHGGSDADAVALVREVDAAVAAVDGAGFRATPFGPQAGLSDALDLDVWVKDETGNVAGSHKARHVMGVLLHLLVAERAGLAPSRSRPPLAIASCGNAALAAATLAAAVDWPIDVFVPPHADPWVLGRLRELGAAVVACPRRADDPPGDPCVHRFRDAVEAGSVPFGVQGPDNALCLDGGRTIGWELAEHEATGGAGRIFVQVGGGALATGVGAGLLECGLRPRVHAVQTEGCAPLARAWTCAGRVGLPNAGRHWHDCMRPWEREPVSLATGILDDETYDWLGVVGGMAATGGEPVVATEADVVAAFDLARVATSVPVDPTGSAGLAGVRALRPHMAHGERVIVLFTGRFRAG
jgi:threonine synthase